MKNTLLSFILFLLWAGNTLAQSKNALKDTGTKHSIITSISPIIANINLQQQKPAITKYHFGQFIENLGNVDVGDLVDDGLWAEMIDDRKFFYPVDTIKILSPINKRDYMNQWTPIGKIDAIKMDSINPFVGKHSPKVFTSNSQTNGIVQSGLWLQNDKKYVGRLYLAGTANVKITISLVWGDKPEQRTTVLIDNLTRDYKKFDLAFISKTSTTNARIEITGIGEGSFSIGAVSLMPEDNIQGFRKDVIQLLKGLHSGIYRWGGNFISGYDWKDGIGDPDKRPPRYEYAWEGLESNDVGSEEIVRFAQLIDVEIAFTVNTGFGDASSAAQWVEYMNGDSHTEMGKLRAKNGFAKPFNIKFWCIGNESYGWWQLGHIDLKSHLIKHRMFVEKMKAVDSSIKIVASGASIDEMTVTESAKKETGKIIAEYDSPADWTGGMLRQNNNYLDFVSEHFYCSVTERFDLTTGKYITIDEPLEDWTRRPANRIKAKAEHYAEYAKRIPALQHKRAQVYLDEWAYYTNWVHPKPTLGVTIGYARGLNEIFRNTDLIKMVGFTFGTSCISFNDTSAVYNATGLLYQLYGSHIASIPVEIDGNSPQPTPKWAIGGEQPNVNAGSNTYPLDMFASLSKDSKFITVTVINPTLTAQELAIKVPHVNTTNEITHYSLTGNSIEAKNVVGKKEEVFLKKASIQKKDLIKIAPASINVYTFEVVK